MFVAIAEIFATRRRRQTKISHENKLGHSVPSG